MPAPSKASPVSVGIAAGLSVLILVLWALQLALLTDLTGSDAAGNAYAQAYAAIAVIILWLLLAVLAAIAYAKGAMPVRAGIAALVLIPASGIVALTALGLLTAPDVAPYRWPLVIPALVPPLVVGFCFWALLPATHARVPARAAAGVVWGVILVLCLSIWPMAQVREQVRQQEAAAREKYDADFKSLPADAPLWALTPFLNTPNESKAAEVVDRIRHLDRRQSDAETMLDRGDFPLVYLGRFDLAPTPALCDKARALLRRRVEPLVLASANAKPYVVIAMEVDGAVAAMSWLIDHGCPCAPEAQAWETMAKAYRDPNYDIYRLAELARKR